MSILYNTGKKGGFSACPAGRLSKGSQPTLLLDGRQLGPLCNLVPLPLPPRLPTRAGGSDEAARQLFFQVRASACPWR